MIPQMYTLSMHCRDFLDLDPVSFLDQKPWLIVPIFYYKVLHLLCVLETCSYVANPDNNKAFSKAVYLDNRPLLQSHEYWIAHLAISVYEID